MHSDVHCNENAGFPTMRSNANDKSFVWTQQSTRHAYSLPSNKSCRGINFESAALKLDLTRYIHWRIGEWHAQLSGLMVFHYEIMNLYRETGFLNSFSQFHRMLRCKPDSPEHFHYSLCSPVCRESAPSTERGAHIWNFVKRIEFIETKAFGFDAAAAHSTNHTASV